MAQSPAYLQTKIIELDGPVRNTFIDLSSPTYGLPKSIALYGISGVSKVSATSRKCYQEFYDGGSGDPILVFEAQDQIFTFVDILMPYSSFMEDDSSIRIVNGLNVYFQSTDATIPYSSFTVFYK
jgi:hypothetical protein